MTRMAKILITILTLAVLGLGGFIAYDKLYKTDNTPKEESKQENIENVEKETKKDDESNKIKNSDFQIPADGKLGNATTKDQINYTLDISNYNGPDNVYYKLTNEVTVGLKFFENDSEDDFSKDFKSFDVEVNGQKLNLKRYEDDGDGLVTTSDKKDLVIALLGKYLIFNNQFWTDIRDTWAYVVDLSDNNITLFGEMDQIKGVRPESLVKVTSDGLRIEGGRETHDGIAYGDYFYIQKDATPICEDGKPCTNYRNICDLPGNTSIRDEYFYEFKDGILNLNNPKKTSLELAKNHVTYKSECK